MTLTLGVSSDHVVRVEIYVNDLLRNVACVGMKYYLSCGAKSAELPVEIINATSLCFDVERRMQQLYI